MYGSFPVEGFSPALASPNSKSGSAKVGFRLQLFLLL